VAAYEASPDVTAQRQTLEALDALARPAEIISGLSAAMAPGAALSVAIANPVASVLDRAVAGDVAAALELVRAQAGSTPPFGREALLTACLDAGLDVSAVRGVGVVSDLIPGSAQQNHPQALALVAQLEEELAEVDPYRAIATRIHVIARRRR
jgi:hypothetical protein